MTRDRTPSHLRGLASYLAVAPRSVDGTLSFAWTFGLVCAAMVLAAGGVALDVLAFGAPRDQLALGAGGALLGGVGVVWCMRMRRRRLAVRAGWHAAAVDLAASVGGSLLDPSAILPWFVNHWTAPVRVEDLAHSPCAHAIVTSAALIHFEPEGSASDSELPDAHLVVFAPAAITSSGFVAETVDGHTVARLEPELRARVFAKPEALGEVTPPLRALLDRARART